MRDLETLVRESRAFQTGEEALAWFNRLTLDERILFLQQWHEDIVAEVKEIWESKMGTPWEINIPKNEVMLPKWY